MLYKDMTQEDRVIAYIRETGGVTNAEAFRKLNIVRLSAVIHSLRERGYDIETEMVTTKKGKRYGRDILND